MIDYDQVAAEYARHRQVHPAVLKNLLSTPNLGSNSRVLEIGCGTGNYTSALHESPDCDCWGIDPSGEMLAAARTRSSGVTFLVGGAERLTLESEAFDLIFSVDVIHHVIDRASCFHEAYRVLRNGGRICTTTDSEWIIRHRRPLADYFPLTIDADLERYPSIADLRDVMHDQGFRKITEIAVERAFQQTDATAYRDKAFSVLHLIPDATFQRGIDRMERDLRAGPIPGVSRYLLLWGTK